MDRGTLYIIASPIGNLEDITLRAVRVLQECADFAYCEDTRQTRKLFDRHGISLPADSLHAHSHNSKIQSAIQKLSAGKSIAYLTDSGTPGLSDPGSRLVREARAAGFPVVPVPGPSALAAAVSVSGFPGKDVLFAGFLSKKPGRRKHELEKLRAFPGQIAVYESPHRIRKLLLDIRDVFGEVEVLVAREISKMHEDISVITLDATGNTVESVREQGEFTVIINNGS